MDIDLKAYGIQRDGSRLMTSKADDRLAQLYAAHANAAGRLALLLTRDADAAQDITQEAFARVGTRLATLRDPDRAAGYLFRTVSNLAKGHGRRLSRHRALPQRLAKANQEAQPDLGARDEMWQALMKLSLRQRTALFLRYYLDLSEAESARSLDCSIEAIKSLTHRAIEALRKHVKGASS